MVKQRLIGVQGDQRSSRRWSLVTSLLLAIGLFAALPLTVLAGTVTNRSVELSNSAEGEAEVTYTVKFTAASNDTSAFVVDFCENSPVVTESCQPPEGLDVTNTIGTSGADTVSQLTDSAALVELSVTADTADEVEVDLTGITNSTTAGAIYARIVTYSSAQQPGDYQSGSPGAYLDDGAVALTITEDVGVGGTVLESLEFCTSADELDINGCDGVLSPPNIKLGSGGALELSATTATVYSQVSTNASSGAVISLKSDATGCGGLVRRGAPEACDITPLTTAGTIDEGTANIGLRLQDVDGGTGVIMPATGYSTSLYYLNYVSGDKTGITSPFGDPVYTTDGAPISGGRVGLRFAANRANDTPAGDYSVSLSLVATGRY